MRARFIAEVARTRRSGVPPRSGAGGSGSGNGAGRVPGRTARGFKRIGPSALVRTPLHWLRLGLAAGLLLLAGGCYSFTGSNLPGHIKALAVPTVRNATLEPGVEQEITEGIVDRFISDGRLKIASERAAHAVFLAELTGYENKVNNYTANQEPIDYIVVLTLSAQMRDQVKNRDLWKADRLVATAVYEPGAGETEESARAEAIQILAGDVVGKTLEQW